MIWNCPNPEIDAIVISDGSRILGLGDVGLNGLAIPQGKLDLYVAAAGFHPARVLPVILDVGTDNAELRSDPFYFGLKRRRVRGDAFFEIMDGVMRALASRWPDCVVQFEDFSSDRASAILERYRDHHLCFNDDIQGTAATALAGVYSALAVQGLEANALARQRFVVAGAGSAGCGVSEMLLRAMVEKHGLSPEEARSRFWMLDKDGLITEQRGAAHGRKGATRVSPQAAKFARKLSSTGEDRDGESLLEVVRRVKPTVLIGLAGAGRLFTPEVLRAAGEGVARPVIMAMSSPLSTAECTSSEAAAATGGRAIYASGSPQPDVTLVDEDRRVLSVASSQANNVFVFPGVGLAASLGRTGTVSDGMLLAAAEALPALIEKADLARGAVYPRLSEAREVAKRVAVAVMLQARDEGKLKGAALAALERGGQEELLAHVERRMYVPAYHSLIRLPVGVGE
jgi:malate dehydrogenase (decarboxylating)